MSLPHPNIVFTPLTTITAQDHNNQMANVASLADGTGVNDGAIVGSKLKNSTVTADKIDFTTMPIAENTKIQRKNKTVGDMPVKIQCGVAMINVSAQAVEGAATITFPKQFTTGTIPTVVCSFGGYGQPGDEWTDTPNSSWGGCAFSAVGVTNTSFTARCRRFDGAQLLGTYYVNWIAIG